MYPMWNNESQLIGMRKCTPWGYRFHCIAELLGFIGLILLIALPVYLIYRAIAQSFDKHLLWLLAFPFGIALVSQTLYQFSCVLARRKHFEYDYDKREASWIENGGRVTYSWKQGQENPK